jgi:hypothetical protein
MRWHVKEMNQVTGRHTDKNCRDWTSGFECVHRQIAYLSLYV